jgi:hypothetical protein
MVKIIIFGHIFEKKALPFPYCALRNDIFCTEMKNLSEKEKVKGPRWGGSGRNSIFKVVTL